MNLGLKVDANGSLETDRLRSLDFARHNEENAALWDAFGARAESRSPSILGTNTRFFMLLPDADPEGVDFRAYSEDPDVMYETTLRFARWSRFNLLQDTELGLPERWGVGVDFQNYYEAAWFGCPIQYVNNEVPDTLPAFKDAPERVMENGLPDPFGGLFAKGKEFFEHMKARAAHEDFLGRPVDVYSPGGGSDGPMTVACNLFGPDFVCEAMAAEPERLQTLFAFITEATILRMRAWRDYVGFPTPTDGFWLADDSIALISTAMYIEHVLPWHKRIYDELGTEKDRGMHLCGNATRHFPTIVRELHVQAFDTGFPVDFACLRKQLGPDVLIQGGPHVELVRSGTPEKVYAESRRILASGVRAGGRFVLREANNLAPGTPLENTEAMRQAAIDHGSAA